MRRSAGRQVKRYSLPKATSFAAKSAAIEHNQSRQLIDPIDC